MVNMNVSKLLKTIKVLHPQGRLELPFDVANSLRYS